MKDCVLFTCVIYMAFATAAVCFDPGNRFMGLI